MKKKPILKSLAFCGSVSLASYYVFDIIKNLSIKPKPERPKSDDGAGLVHELLLCFENPSYQKEQNIKIDEDYIINALLPAKKYIDGRYDCQDFRMHSLLRLAYSHFNKLLAISPKAAVMIEEIFLNSKYWMTEKGDDSLCFWSENHQILYAVAEYLAGQMWQDRVFSNDGATGKEHMQRAKKRIEYWMQQRFLFGFSEFNSTNYYLYNVGPMANFIEFAADEDFEMVERMKMCLDLLFFDVAANMQGFTFTAPTGRAYVDNMVGMTGDRVKNLIDFFWLNSDDYKSETHQMLINFYAMYFAKDKDEKPKNLYELPLVLFEIGRDEQTRIIKASYGLNTKELEEKGYVGHADNQIMRQLSMEAFTNPEVIYNTVSYFSKHKMFANNFINYFKVINLKLLKKPETLRFISKKLNPMPNGIAIQRANFYSYKTKDYALMSLQKYLPNSYGAQQMLNTLSFGQKSIVFTAHPAREEAENTVSAYPGYWAGYGRAPHSVQHKNVLIILYDLPKTSGFLELYSVPQFTHTYLPEAFFDEVIIDGKYVFFRHGDSFAAIIGKNNLYFKPFSNMSAEAFKNGLEAVKDKRFDLIQEGNKHYWIYELSDISLESFDEFKNRIRQNNINYDGKKISYTSKSKEYKTSFDGHFFVDDNEIRLEHKRFDSKYCKAERECDEFNFSFKGHSLKLNYNKCIRKYDKAYRRNDI